MIYREYEIEAFEVGRSQWHARFRRTDRARARGFGPALTPSVKVSSLLLPPGGFFLLIGQARQPADSLSLAAGFEVRPKEAAGKIEQPTAVRTVFEGLEG